MNRKAKGRLIIIGGHEDKTGEQTILKEVCQDTVDQGGKLMIVTVASSMPEEMAKEYVKVFKKLGVPQVDVLDIRERAEAEDPKNVQKLEQASAIFFTGGDQLRISSQIGDSPVYQHMQRLLKEGHTVAGTSAGAAVMPETMIVSGPSDESNKIDALNMAPGLGLIEGVVIDSHFAERGRMGRLLGAVALNPKNLGLGIDENTAVVIEGGEELRVVGSGAVYVVDGTGISFSSLSEKNAEGVISIYNVKLHVLSREDLFDLNKRAPTYINPDEVETKEKQSAD